MAPSALKKSILWATKRQVTNRLAQGGSQTSGQTTSQTNGRWSPAKKDQRRALRKQRSGADLLAITREEGHFKLVGNGVFFGRWKMVHLDKCLRSDLPT